MVRLAKLLKLGGFSDWAGNAGGFAKKVLPLDTPHDDNKPRFKVNALGQKVADAGMTQSEFRHQYIRALGSECSSSDRETYLRALGLLAEKGDTEAAEVVVRYVESDADPNVRMTALENLAFTAVAPTKQSNKMILGQIGIALNDSELKIRAKVIDILGVSCANIDAVEADRIEPKDKKGVQESRKFAWRQFSAYSIALNCHKQILLLLFNLLSYSVLPVRFCVWTILSRPEPSHQRTIDDCKAQEQVLYELLAAFKPIVEAHDRARAVAQDLRNKILDNSRDYVSSKLSEMQDRGFNFEAGDHTLLNKMHDEILSADTDYCHLNYVAEEKLQLLQNAQQDIEVQSSLYRDISRQLCIEIIESLAQLLAFECPIINSVNSILGHNCSSAWFIRRVILQEWVIPLAQTSDRVATDLLRRCRLDQNPFVRRVVERAMKDLRMSTGGERELRSEDSTELDGDIQSSQTAQPESNLSNAARTLTNSIQTLREERNAQARLERIAKRVIERDDSVLTSTYGVGCILLMNSEREIVFKRVTPITGDIDEGDILIKIVDSDMKGKSIVDAKQIFMAAGDMCPCVVQRSKYNKRSRVVYISCQPPPYHDECLESIGLDIEVYKSDSIRTLQVISFLKRHGFEGYSQRVIGDLKIRQLATLASKYDQPSWVALVGMEPKDQTRFENSLNMLAAQYGLEDTSSPSLLLEKKMPPNAHEIWRFIRGKANMKSEIYKGKCRTADISSSLDEFRSTGRLPTVFEKFFEGVDYTIFWHTDLNMVIEMMDDGAGTFRVLIAGSNNFESPSASDKCFVCFSDGRIEPVKSLRAHELLARMRSSEKGSESSPDITVLPPLESRFSESTAIVSGSSFGFGMNDALKAIFRTSKPRSQLAQTMIDGEQLVGRHVEPEVGMRVVLCTGARKEFPELLAESGNTIGTITWVDEDDADGDGHTGDFCEVAWDNGYTSDYRTGFEGVYRLALVSKPNDPETDQPLQETHADETVVGLDIAPEVGQRVVFCAASLAENPGLIEDSAGGPGTITWVDPDDLDGDGITGDICEVAWDRTGLTGEYRTGFEGCFRLALYRRKPSRIAEAVSRKERVGSVSIPDNPWSAMQEMDDTHSQHKASFKNRMDSQPVRTNEIASLTSEGTDSRIAFGHWTAETVLHDEQGLGSTIRICFHSRRPLAPDLVLEDLGRLRTRLGAADSVGLLSHPGFGSKKITKEAASGAHDEREFEIHLTGEGFLIRSCRAPTGVVNSVEDVCFDANGPGRISRLESELHSGGVPLEVIRKTSQARQKVMLGAVQNVSLQASLGTGKGKERDKKGRYGAVGGRRLDGLRKGVKTQKLKANYDF